MNNYSIIKSILPPTLIPSGSGWSFSSRFCRAVAISLATSGRTVELARTLQNADMLCKKETIKEAHISFSSFDHITRKVVRCDLVIIILYYLVLSPLLLLQLHLIVLNFMFSLRLLNSPPKDLTIKVRKILLFLT